MNQQQFLNLIDQTIEKVVSGAISREDNDSILRKVFEIKAPKAVVDAIISYHVMQITIARNAGIPKLKSARDLLLHEIKLDRN